MYWGLSKWPTSSGTGRPLRSRVFLSIQSSLRQMLSVRWSRGNVIPFNQQRTVWNGLPNNAAKSVMVSLPLSRALCKRRARLSR